ncbi:MAG TPA: hypothetical protein VLT36_12960 [Candidatus Dormibacteraeota bacterium]|nr:hypothetical protein [Candidatus Dormibacteraeota bacterium]
MPIIQEAIHKLEVAGGSRYLKLGLALIVLAGVTVWYNFRSFKNMATQEAMDAAQLGHNLAEGRGYTTSFIRPFSMYLLRKHNEENFTKLTEERRGDMTEIKTRHPDISNPPVYPLLLGAFQKIIHIDYSTSTTKAFFSKGGRFWRSKSDFYIAVINELLFFGVIAMAFLLARRLFSSAVAWTSALLLFGMDLLWRFSVSGLSTMLLLLIFLALVWCLVLLEEGAREVRWGIVGVVVLAAAAGLLTGFGGLTRYSFAWLILPVLAFLLLYGGPQRLLLACATLAAFVLVMSPWVIRNYRISGTPFGTAGYAIYEDSGLFPGNTLERSLDPDFNRPRRTVFSQKFLTNTREIIETEVPKMSGSWLGAFFLVGLMIGLPNLGASRLRIFILLSLILLIAVQALGRTQLSEDSPQINSENLLVLFAPLVLIFGVSFFFLLLDQIHLPMRELRYAVIGIFCFVGCLPMIFNFLPPPGFPISYPPYYPPEVQVFSPYIKENELTMSDIPWAVAWYGDKQSVWTTLSLQPDFFTINDYQKPISLLYLSRVTLDRHFATQWLEGPEQTWGAFILEAIARKQVPTFFPLRKADQGWVTFDRMILTDWERYRKTPTEEPKEDSGGK